MSDLDKAAAAVRTLAGAPADPFPAYAQLRDAAPVFFDDSMDMYLISRYEDCHRALSSPDVRVPDHAWHDRIMPGWQEHPAAVWCFTSLPFEGHSSHARIRRLVNRAFTRRRVESLVPAIQQVVAGLLDTLEEHGADNAVVDLQDVVGFRLPVAVIASLVGVPDTDLPRFRWVFGDILRVMDLVVDDSTLARANAAMVEVRDYFTELLRYRRDHPADDLASGLLAACDEEGDRLTEEELLSLVILLFTAGFETTTLTIGTGTSALLADRDQYDLLRNDPSLVAGAVSEALRWDCALHRVIRVTDQPVQIGDVAVPGGSVIAPLLGAANRDPQVFEDPDRFDIRRSGPRPLTFGGGAYVCLGNALAQTELEVYFAELSRRFPHMELADEPERRCGYVRGLDTLPVTLGRPAVNPAARAGSDLSCPHLTAQHIG
ncbi:cytochrome P450 [Nocardia sp. NBC_01329]|uniref:cytochrome P450 n=1 Tax=Nocardia sp. NBC_01329 TaxID=2903594 RepID=UPI002E0F8A8A|nr:cytochrome P450 [Nocardia sp. NBC_01329]